MKLLIQKEKDEKQQFQKHLEFSLFSFIEEISPLYQEEKQELFEKISLFQQEHSFLKQKSILEIISKSDWETYHSKLLADFWNNYHSIFCDFIQSITKLSENKQLIKWILERDYKVETEQKTGNNKYIDILITDNQERYCIAVENKINSAVSYHGKETLQLDSYSKHIYKSMPENTQKIFLLLSFCDNKKYTLKNEWIYVDYYKVFKSIDKNYSAEDDILKQYMITLFSLLFNTKEIGGNINEKTSLSEMSFFIKT